MQITLWFVRETEKARLYCKHGRPQQDPSDLVWVPRSVVEHTSKMGAMHILTLPDWWIEREGL